VAKLRECVAARISHYEHSRGRRRVVKVARFRSHRGRHRAECPRMTLHGRRVRPPLRHAASVTRTCPVYTFTASPPHPQHRSSPRRSGRSVANQRCSGNVQQQGPAAAGRSSRPPQLCPSAPYGLPVCPTELHGGARSRAVLTHAKSNAGEYLFSIYLHSVLETSTISEYRSTVALEKAVSTQQTVLGSYYYTTHRPGLGVGDPGLRASLGARTTVDISGT
jgi:hypothetical protein